MSLLKRGNHGEGRQWSNISETFVGHCGPLPTSSKGNCYILVATDLFTKWVEAFPLRSTESSVGHSPGGWDCMLLRSSNGYSQRLGCKPDKVSNPASLRTAWHRAYQDNCISPSEKWQVERFKLHLGSHAGKGSTGQSVRLGYLFSLSSVYVSHCNWWIHTIQPLPSDIWPISNVASGRHFGATTIETSGGEFVEETHQYINDAYATVCSNLKQAYQRQKLTFDKEHGETFREGNQVWLYTSEEEEVTAGNWLPNGMVPVLLWTRPVLSITISSLLELHMRKQWCIKITWNQNLKLLSWLHVVQSPFVQLLHKLLLLQTVAVHICWCGKGQRQSQWTKCKFYHYLWRDCLAIDSVDDHGTHQEISSSDSLQRNGQPQEHYGAPIMYWILRGCKIWEKKYVTSNSK